MSSDPLLPPGSDPNSLPPVSESTPLGAPTNTQATSTGLDPNVAAGLSILFSLIGGIVFLVLEKKNQFVRFWAMQAVFFGAAWFIFSIVSQVMFHLMPGPLALLWGLVAMLVNLGFVVVWIVGLVKSFTGKAWEIPVLGRMAREQLSRTPML